MESLKENGINMLTLFNGMSFASMAMENQGVKLNKVWSSEIDKYANKATAALFPNTIQLGDILNWREWDIDWASVDKVVGGFPCQAWSLAGKQLGDKDERGKLFWVMLDIIKHVLHFNPNADFLIENVKMKKEFEQYITTHTENALGKVHKILINSALVSAQNRNRYYWTNYPVTQPEDKGILLKDIIEGGAVDREKALTVTTRVAGATAKRYLEKSMHQMVIEPTTLEGCIKSHGEWKPETEKSQCIDANYHKGVDNHGQRSMVRPCELRDTQPKESALCHHVATATDINANESNKRIYADSGKSPTLTTMGGGHREPKVLVARATVQKNAEHTYNGKCPTVTAAAGMGGGNVPLYTDQDTAAEFKGKYIDKDHRAKYRKLTPRECFRLQTVSEPRIEVLLSAGISNSQLYKMCGNGMTKLVISHILSCWLTHRASA